MAAQNPQQSYPVSPLGSPGFNSGTPQTDFIDLTVKRRSNSLDKEADGKPFISVDRSNRPPKRSFFFDSDISDTNDDLQLKDQLLTRIKGLNQYQCFNMCNELQIAPPTLSILYQFVDALNPADSHALQLIENLLNKQNQIRAENLGPRKPGINPNTLLDCRYSLIENSENILEKTVIGLSEFDVSFDLVPFPPPTHVILQSFVINETQQAVYFPKSLRIFINNTQVKGPGPYPFPVFDLTKYCNNLPTNVRIVCGNEKQAFTIEAVPAYYNCYHQIIETIQNGQVIPENIEGPVSLLCPITGRLMKHPCRGVHCQHLNCFDMKSYLKLGNLNRQWFCPICKQPLPVHELMYSHKTKEIIRAATGQTSSSMALPQFTPQAQQQLKPSQFEVPDFDGDFSFQNPDFNPFQQQQDQANGQSNNSFFPPHNPDEIFEEPPPQDDWDFLA